MHRTGLARAQILTALIELFIHREGAAAQYDRRGGQQRPLAREDRDHAADEPGPERSHLSLLAGRGAVRRARRYLAC